MKLYRIKELLDDLHYPKAGQGKQCNITSRELSDLLEELNSTLEEWGLTDTDQISELFENMR
jgi:hypothetical protein